MMILKLENVSFAYENFGVLRKQVLENINLEIRTPEIIGILGHSGSGKTTLIQLFNGILASTSGQIFLDQRKLGTSEIKMQEVHRQVGLVFQFPENQFFEETVYTEIAFGLKNISDPAINLDAAVRQALEMVGMDYAEIQGRNPYFLSAGEKRRIAIASIIAMKPEFLILDEPTAGLDMAGIRILKTLIKQYAQLKKTIVIVSHNMELLFDLVERMIILNQGKIVFDGPRQELILLKDQLTDWGIKIPRYFYFMDQLQRHSLLSSHQPLLNREQLLAAL